MLSPGWIISNVVRLWMFIVPLILITFYLFSSSQHIPLPSISAIKSSPANLYHAATASRKEAFVADFTANEIDGPFDTLPLVELCESKHWVPGLIFKCDPAIGGVGNVRNIFLNCLRYAIEAGATGFVLPTLVPVKSEVPVPMDYFFDIHHFTTHLSVSCPEMTVYPSIDALWEFPSTSPPLSLSPEAFGGPYIHNSIMTTPSNWTNKFFAHLETVHPTQYTNAMPILVSLKLPLLLQWPLRYDSPTFIATFGRLLRFKTEIKELAGTVLYALTTQHSLSISSVSGILPGNFYGAHLRTAKDAQAAGWTSYAEQSENYIEHADHFQLPVIYTVAGNPKDLKSFGREAGERNISITTKEQLLSAPGFENERAHLRTLGWDLRGCVDWEVLLWSSQFGGIWESSFSWGVGLRRHVVDSQGGWTNGKGAMKGKRDVDSQGSGKKKDVVENATKDSQPEKQAADPEIKQDKPPVLPASGNKAIKVPGSVDPNPVREIDAGILATPLVSQAASKPTVIKSVGRPVQLEVPPKSSSLPPPKSDLSAITKSGKNGKEKAHSKPAVMDEREAFQDGISIIFGSSEEGDMFFRGMWP